MNGCDVTCAPLEKGQFLHALAFNGMFQVALKGQVVLLPKSNLVTPTVTCNGKPLGRNT